MSGAAEEPNTEPDALRRARFVVAYRGTGFRGFAANDGVRTVMGELAAAVERVTRRPFEYSMSGRTDAGVHGWGQVVSGDLPDATDLDDLARRLNKMCGPEIAVRSADWAPADFDARFSATWRRYRYDVWNDAAANPLRVETTWHVARPLDLAAMQSACADLPGEHDFTSFCRLPKVDDDHPPPSMVRIVHEADWQRIDGSPLLRFEIRASAYCHQMVRSIVGTLVDIGQGRIRADAIPDILAAKDRSRAGRVAPPDGLVLWDVGYDGERWDAS